MKRTPLRRKRPFVSKYRPRPGLRQARNFVRSRANGRCEARVEGVCTGWGESAHHVVRRSQGGSDDPANLLWVCNADHEWIHRHPEQAKALGLLRSSESRSACGQRRPVENGEAA